MKVKPSTPGLCVPARPGPVGGRQHARCLCARCWHRARDAEHFLILRVFDTRFCLQSSLMRAGWSLEGHRHLEPVSYREQTIFQAGLISCLWLETHNTVINCSLSSSVPRTFSLWEYTVSVRYVERQIWRPDVLSVFGEDHLSQLCNDRLSHCRHSLVDPRTGHHLIPLTVCPGSRSALLSLFIYCSGIVFLRLVPGWLGYGP